MNTLHNVKAYNMFYEGVKIITSVTQMCEHHESRLKTTVSNDFQRYLSAGDRADHGRYGVEVALKVALDSLGIGGAIDWTTRLDQDFRNKCKYIDEGYHIVVQETGSYFKSLPDDYEIVSSYKEDLIKYVNITMHNRTPTIKP